MDIKIINETIWEIEKKLPIARPHLLGFDVWPLIRLALFQELSQGVSKNKSALNRLPELFDVLLCLIISRFRLFSSRKKNRIEPTTKILFIGRPQHYHSINGSRLLYDRVIDPLIDSLDFDFDFAKSCLGVPPKCKMYLSPIRLKLRGRFRISSELEAQLSSHIQKLIPSELCSSGLFNRSINHVNTFNASYRKAQTLLNKCPSIRHIVLSVWYSPDAMGLIAAAKARNILTIDVQHGSQGKFHGMYGTWNCMPEGGYEMIPSMFWCWAPKNTNAIYGEPDNNPSIRTIVGGYPWPAFKEKFQDGGLNKNSGLDTHPIRVVYSLQSAHFNNLGIPDFVTNFLVKENNRVKFYFKHHPNERNQKLIEQQISNLDLKTCYTFVNPESDLVALLKNATHHITAYSSVAYEALLAHVPTLLFGDESKEIMSEALSDKVFTWSTGTTSELAEFLSTGFNTTVPFEDYISSSISLTSMTMRIVSNL